jgi:hypothetical protein
MVWVWSSPATADHSSIHFTATGDVAATDNVFSAPDNREADIFTQVRPGVLFAYDAPRMIHELTAEAEILEYAAHEPTKPSLTAHGGWHAIFMPGPRSEVLLSANAGTGRLQAITTSAGADQAVTGVLPSGAVDTQQADGTENASYQVGKDTRIGETLLALWTTTDDNAGSTTSTFEAAGNLAVDYSFYGGDSIGVEAGVSYVRLELIAPATAAMPSRLNRQVNPHGSARWRHDFNRNWSGGIDGGLVYVHPVGTDPFNPTDTSRKPALFPTGNLQVAYVDTWGRATGSIFRNIAPNLFIAQNTVNEGINGHVALPLPWLDDSRRREPKLVALGTLGVERSQLLDAVTNDTQGTFDVYHLDVGVAWTPVPGQTWGVRYEFLHQSGDSMATIAIPGFTRNTLFFTFAFRYPDRLAVVVPRNRQSMRADRKDLTPIGEEPVVPDEPAGQGSQGGDSD